MTSFGLGVSRLKVSFSTMSDNDTNQIESNITRQYLEALYEKLGYRYQISLIVEVPIAVFGLICNIIAFIVLTKHPNSLTTNLLLKGIAVTDCLVLIAFFCVNPLQKISVRYLQNTFYVWVFPYLLVLLYPSFYIVRLTGSYLLCLLVFDRWFAVSRPLHVYRVCSVSKTKRYTIIILVASIIFSFPRFFEHKIELISANNTDTANLLKLDQEQQINFILNSRENFTFYAFKKTNIFFNEYYFIVYNMILFPMIMYVIPLAFLTTFNTKLALSFRREFHYRSTVLRVSNEILPNRSVTLMIIIINTVHITFTVIILTSQIIYFFSTFFKDPALKTCRRKMALTSNILVNLNSACNLLIYCYCSRTFRHFLRRMICKWQIKKKRKKGESTNSSLLAVSWYKTSRN